MKPKQDFGLYYKMMLMETLNNDKSRDFSIIFNEIEKFHEKDSSILNNLSKDEDITEDESIRKFGEICREISSNDCSTTVFLTFS